MKTAVKALMAGGLIMVAGAAAVGATDQAAPVAKDQPRVLSDAGKSRTEDYGHALLQLAQAARPRPPIEGPTTLVPKQADNDGPHGVGPAGPGFPGPRPAPFEPSDRPPVPFADGAAFGVMAPDRFACEEDIDRHAALAGYLKSKLRLDGAQKDAWQKIEQAAEPVVEKMQKACASLPGEPGEPPDFAAMITMADQQLALRAEFVHAIVAPVLALYGMLSPEQQRVLDRPLPPMH